MLKVKRIYEASEPSDGYRILVDRIWPRGVSKEKARIDLWMKQIAPSDALRKWFGHDPVRWMEFQRRYHEELAKEIGLTKQLKQLEHFLSVSIHSTPFLGMFIDKMRRPHCKYLS